MNEDIVRAMTIRLNEGSLNQMLKKRQEELAEQEELERKRSELEKQTDSQPLAWLYKTKTKSPSSFQSLLGNDYTDNNRR